MVQLGMSPSAHANSAVDHPPFTLRVAHHVSDRANMPIKTQVISGDQDESRIFYSRSEVAEALTISIPTLDRLISKGELRAAKIGRRAVVSPQALDEFRKVAETAEWGSFS
jgi:excisionase family DNA binding protein